jgi:hypothetical protein
VTKVFKESRVYKGFRVFKVIKEIKEMQGTMALQLLLKVL